MSRALARALLVDCDGVVRRFDPAISTAIEARYGLASGEVTATVLDSARLQPAITGASTWAARIDESARTLADRVGDLATARRLLADWEAYRGEVVPEVLAFVKEVRASGRPVALATNATDVLDADLAALGLVGQFDAVVNSSVLRVHKPTREFFDAACRAVQTPPNRCLFVDDSDRNVRGARVAGLSAYRWSGPADLPYLRASLGL
jgi:putative hydrolase of the HAD superfamily